MFFDSRGDSRDISIETTEGWVCFLHLLVLCAQVAVAVAVAVSVAVAVAGALPTHIPPDQCAI